MSIDKAWDWISRARNSDGSWGYLAGQPGRAEPTLLAAAAGHPAPVEWLSAADLGFGRLLLPAALSGVPEAADLCRTTAVGLLELRGVPGEPSPDLGHDPTIPGWSWVPETAPWVEPTAYALISLKKWGYADHERVRQGEAMLVDRQCDDGGWNYGNTAVLGQRLTGNTGTTAWAVMALPPGPAVDHAWPMLGATEPSGSSLALAILARVAHGRDVEDLPARLLARQQADGAFNARVDTTALAVLALRAATEGTHVFHLPA